MGISNIIETYRRLSIELQLAIHRDDDAAVQALDLDLRSTFDTILSHHISDTSGREDVEDMGLFLLACLKPIEDRSPLDGATCDKIMQLIVHRS